MSRRRKNINFQREIKPDPIYKDIVVASFINKMMLDGKKEKARQIVYGAFEEIKKKQPSDEPLTVFKKAIENCKPTLEVRSRRVGGATYQVPIDVSPRRRLTLALRWLALNSRNRKGKSMAERLAMELMDAAQQRGGSFKKKEDVHRMADANRAFSHFNW